MEPADHTPTGPNPTPRPSKAGDETRAKLVTAAEQLMAEHGIDGVELKAIVAAAGQRNRSAITYHFGDRQGLVRAISVKHRPRINTDRHKRLDRLGADPSVHDLVTALVTPLSRSLATPDGRCYLIILAESASRLGTSGLYEAQADHADSARRLIAELYRALPGSDTHRRRQIGKAILATPIYLADLARDVNRGSLTPNQAQRRVPTIITFITGGLTTPQPDTHKRR